MCGKLFGLLVRMLEMAVSDLVSQRLVPSVWLASIKRRGSPTIEPSISTRETKRTEPRNCFAVSYGWEVAWAGQVVGEPPSCSPSVQNVFAESAIGHASEFHRSRGLTLRIVRLGGGVHEKTFN